MGCSLALYKSVILRRLTGVFSETRSETANGTAARREYGSAQNSSMFYFNISVKFAREGGNGRD